jgi:hypothetical protein
MRWNQAASVLFALVLTGCATIVVSNYRPGTTVSATVGYPLIDVQWRLENIGQVPARQLIYGGRSGDTIKLTYWQARNGQGSPVHTQEVQFDLSRSNTITFQEMRLEVIEASNEKISAHVLPAAKEESRGLDLEPSAPRETTDRDEGARPFSGDY